MRIRVRIVAALAGVTLVACNAPVKPPGKNPAITKSEERRAEHRREKTSESHEMGRIEGDSVPLSAPLVTLPSASASPEIVSAPPAEPAARARVHPPVEQFAGTWFNVNSRIDSWPRVEIRARTDTVSVHIWGKCRPVDCDLGTLDAPYTGSPIVLLQDLGFVKSQFTLWVEGETMRMKMASHFTDDSGRPDGVHEARFHR